MKTLLTHSCAFFLASFSACLLHAEEASAYRVGVFHQSNGTAASWTKSLRDSGTDIHVEEVSYEEGLSKSDGLLRFDCLVFPDASSIPPEMHPALREFARNGRDFVFAGGRAFSKLAEEGAPLPFTDLIFNAAPRYRFEGNLSVREYPQGKPEVPVSDAYRNGSPLTGWSAIGYAFPGQSEFEPILEVVDDHGRRAGWAAGLLRHTDGPFKGGNWFLAGIEEPAFYDDPPFRRWMIETVRAASSRDGEAALSTHKISIGEGGHFFKPDGSRFFVTGTNYLGPFDAKLGTFFTTDSFSPETLDADFSKARSAGINLLRSFSFGSLKTIEIPGRVKAIRNSARKHGIHILPEIGIKAALSRGPVDLTDISRHAATVAAAWRDEPIILGYDLANEPYVAQVGAITFYGKPSPIVQLRPYETHPDLMTKWWVDQQMKDTDDWIHLPPWLDEDTKRQLLAATSIWTNFLKEHQATGSTFAGFDAPLDLSKTGKYWPFLVELDKTFRLWIDAMKKPIQANDPNALVTIGYNTGLIALPANAEIDFLSNHIYQDPVAFHDAEISLGSMSRMKNMYPDKPVILGEFGLTNGKDVNGAPASYQSSALWEFLHYLHAHTHDLDGCAKWMLGDWTAPYIKRHAKWWEGTETAREQEEFGMFWFDGTPDGVAKPIVWCLRSFSAHIANHPAPGNLRVFESKNQVRVGFEYQAEGAWYYGGEAFASDAIRWNDPSTKVVLATWDAEKISVTSTVDMEIEIRPALMTDPASSDAGSDLPWKKFSLLAGEARNIER